MKPGRDDSIALAARQRDASPPSDVVLSVRNLVVRARSRRGVVHAVNGVSFDLHAGEAIGLVGESGCGKSMTSLAIMGLLPAPGARIESGEIWFDEVDLVQLAERQMRRVRGKEISMILQDPHTSLNPVTTIGEQVAEAVRAHDDPGRRSAALRAEELLRRVGLPDPHELLRRYPHQLSGGMKQRVAIAMALALRPRVLIADEPTTALDVTVQAQVLELLRTLTAELNTAIILISHDLGVMARMTSRIAVMYAGFIVETAQTRELFATPRHPYTVGLLHSIPTIGTRAGALTPIGGSPPNMRREPKGCPFQPRCSSRVDACSTTMPPLVPIGGRGQFVACHNPIAAGESPLELAAHRGDKS